MKRPRSADLLARMTLAAVTPASPAATPSSQTPAAAIGEGGAPKPPRSRFLLEEGITADAARAQGALITVDIGAIDPDPAQPRRTFDETAMFELQQTISAVGIIQPPGVRKHPSEPGRYMINWGERRWRASRNLGHKTIDVVLCPPMSESELRIRQIVENCDRARTAVRPIEEAQAIGWLVNELKSTTVAAKRLGVSKSYVSKRVDLLDLPDELSQLMQNDGITDVETVIALKNLRALDEGSYAGFVAEAKSGQPLKRERVLAKLRAAKSPAKRSDGPSPELAAKLAEVKSRLTRAFEQAGLHVRAESLDIISGGARAHSQARLVLSLTSWTGAEGIAQAIERAAKN